MRRASKGHLIDLQQLNYREHKKNVIINVIIIAETKRIMTYIGRIYTGNKYVYRRVYFLSHLCTWNGNVGLSLCPQWIRMLLLKVCIYIVQLSSIIVLCASQRSCFASHRYVGVLGEEFASQKAYKWWMVDVWKGSWDLVALVEHCGY